MFNNFMKDRRDHDAAGRDAAKKVCVPKIGFAGRGFPTYNIFLKDQSDLDAVGCDTARL